LKVIQAAFFVGMWFVGGDNSTGALHDLQLQLSPPPPLSLAPLQHGDILVPANPGSPGKMAVKMEIHSWECRPGFLDLRLVENSTGQQ